MISSGIRNIIQLLTILLLLNIVLASYEAPYRRRYPSATSNQRSADSGYRYAWFTRDIHDDTFMNDEENNLREEELSPQKLYRMKILKSIFNQKYSNSDETLSE